MEQKLIYRASSLNGKTSNNFLEIRSSNLLFAPSLYYQEQKMKLNLILMKNGIKFRSVGLNLAGLG